MVEWVERMLLKAVTSEFDSELGQTNDFKIDIPSFPAWHLTLGRALSGISCSCGSENLLSTLVLHLRHFLAKEDKYITNYNKHTSAKFFRF